MQKFILPHIDTIPCKISITGQDARHIFKVLRLKTGDSLNLTDGRGNDFKGKIIDCAPDRINLDISGSIDSTTESNLDITLCTGMLKDKKMDLVIKHVTQLGIKRWVPFYGDRSIPKYDAGRLKKKMTRWNSIARESLKQCQRSLVPEIFMPLSFEQAVTLSEEADLKIAFWENATTRLDHQYQSDTVKSITLLIGPEGGFSKPEISLAQSNGFDALSLGPRILRAETAAISSCTLMQYLFGDI